MSKYTTGEIAKLCGVSVRTVQYYDSRNILIPSELSEGGRRLYSEQDLKRMKIICFLRDAGISINSIGELLSEDNPGSVISVLLEQQEQLLQEEVSERKAKLEMIDGIRRELKSMENFSVESIGDIAYAMGNKKKMNQLHAILLISGIPIREQTTVLFSTHILSDVERICTDVAFLNNGVVGVQGKLSDIKTRYRSEEYQLETGNDTDMLILQQTFPNMQQIGRNQLVFCEGDYTAFDILRFIADRHIALLKLERAEPTLESLFMEVVEK